MLANNIARSLEDHINRVNARITRLERRPYRLVGPGTGIYTSIAQVGDVSTTWTINTFEVEAAGPVTYLSLDASYKAGQPTITANAAGNITDQVIGTLTSPWRPTHHYTFAWKCASRGSFGTGYIGTAGSIALGEMVPNLTLVAGDAVQLSATYIRTTV